MEDKIRKGMYIYIRLDHFVAQQKLAQYCKLTKNILIKKELHAITWMNLKNTIEKEISIEE